MKPNNWFNLFAYWQTESRILSNPHSRLARVDHHSLARATYVLETARGLHPIEVKTESMMEFARGLRRN